MGAANFTKFTHGFLTKKFVAHSSGPCRRGGRTGDNLTMQRAVELQAAAPRGANRAAVWQVRGG